MAASRSVPSSPRPGSSGYGTPGKAPAPKSLGSPTVLHWTSRSGKTARHAVGGDSPPDGAHFSFHGHGNGQMKRPSSKPSTPGSPSVRGFGSPRDGPAVHVGHGDTFLTEGHPDALQLLHTAQTLSPSSPQSRQQKAHWPQYEYSDDEEEVDNENFRGLQEDSEDSRHFYVPPLAHAGLRGRPASGGPDQPVYKRTTAAAEQRAKGPAQFMHEIRGALDDLKALSKLQINSPRSSPRSSPRATGSGAGGAARRGNRTPPAGTNKTRSRGRSGDAGSSPSRSPVSSNLDKGAKEMDLPIFV